MKKPKPKPKLDPYELIRIREISPEEIEAGRKLMDKAETHGETICALIKKSYHQARNEEAKILLIKALIRARAMFRRMEEQKRELDDLRNPNLP